MRCALALARDETNNPNMFVHRTFFLQCLFTQCENASKKDINYEYVSYMRTINWAGGIEKQIWEYPTAYKAVGFRM